jgi:rhodanese-related sulfurtransferase
MNSKDKFSNISVAELADRMRSGKIDLIDVRTPAEFREVHASPARNIPLDALDSKMLQRRLLENEAAPIYLICRSGNRSVKASERLSTAGYANVVNVEGGTLAWQQAGLPVVRGKKTISLERQVRIAAGLIALIGGALALLVHPLFALIPALVGAGLVFAGITDTCGMGMILARMPWNQGGDCSACSSR